MAEQGHKATLNVYDLSQGIARQLSTTFLGKAIEGIWFLITFSSILEWWYVDLNTILEVAYKVPQLEQLYMELRYMWWILVLHVFQRMYLFCICKRLVSVIHLKHLQFADS